MRWLTDRHVNGRNSPIVGVRVKSRRQYMQISLPHPKYSSVGQVANTTVKKSRLAQSGRHFLNALMSVFGVSRAQRVHRRRPTRQWTRFPVKEGRSLMSGRFAAAIGVALVRNVISIPMAEQSGPCCRRSFRVVMSSLVRFDHPLPTETFWLLTLVWDVASVIDPADLVPRVRTGIRVPGQVYRSRY